MTANLFLYSCNRVFQPLAECLMLAIVSILFVPAALLHAFRKMLHPVSKGVVTEPKVIAITGAASGIGRCLAERYAKPGVTLVLCDINYPLLKEAAEGCRKRGAVVEASHIDVADQEKVRKWVFDADDAHNIDIMVANAGITCAIIRSQEGNMGLSDGLTARRLHEINQLGVVHAAYAALERMRPRKHGQIAIMSSLTSTCSVFGNYSSGKAMLAGIAHSMRQYAADDNISVSLLQPGWVQSPMTDKFHGKQPFKVSTEDAIDIVVDGLNHGDATIAFPLRMLVLSRVFNALPPPLWHLMKIKPQL